jgi:hypothetical protein
MNILYIFAFLFLFIFLYYSRFYFYDFLIKESHTFQLIPLNKKICAENLKLFNSICTKWNIPFWLSEGTALGMRRNSDFIDWDDDIDVGIPISYKYRFFKFAIPDLKSSGFLIGDLRFDDAFLVIYRHHEKIDIDFTGKNIPCMAVYNQSCNILLPYLQHFHTIQYNGDLYYLPSDSYLEFLYGPHWHIPVQHGKPNQFK